MPPALHHFRQISAPGIAPFSPNYQTPVGRPSRIGLDDSGNLFVAEGTIPSLIFQVSPDGQTTRIASTALVGPNGSPGQTTEGLPATISYFSSISDMAVSPDGRIYVSAFGALRTFYPGGIVQMVADSTLMPPFLAPGESNITTEIQYQPSQNAMIALDHQGNLFVSQINRSRTGGTLIGPSLDGSVIRKFTFGSLPQGAAGLGGWYIPDDQTEELFLFDAQGRHLSTMDGATNTVIRSFFYDAKGQLTTIIDGNGNSTQINRDANGIATSIVAPGGQTTTLTIGADGYLASLTNPATEITQLQYQPNGLLTRLTRPGGGISTFTYDTKGRLIKDANSEAGTTTLLRTEMANGYTVSKTAASGLVESYTLENRPNGDLLRTYTNPAGGTRVTQQSNNGTTKTTMVDGTVITENTGSDPVWGRMKPRMIQRTMKLPSGKTRTLLVSRQAQLASPLDPLSLISRTTTLTEKNAVGILDAVTTRSYDAATRVITDTSATGRIRQTTLDAQGRVIRFHYDATQDDIIFTYNAKGQLIQRSKGSSVETYAYDTKNRRISRTNALGQTVLYGYDAADRIISVSRPSGSIIRKQYDADGRLIALTPPNGSAHLMNQHYNGNVSRYTPPLPGVPLQYQYDIDGLRTGSTAGTSTMTITKDAAGRLSQQKDALGSTALLYPAGDSGKRASQFDYTPTQGTGQSVAVSYDGALIKQFSFAGSASGTATTTLLSNWLPSQLQLVSGADTSTTAISWNLDRQQTAQANFSIDRTGPDHLPIGMSDTVGNLSWGYDPSQRLLQQGLLVNGVSGYSNALQHDLLGRIIQSTETVAGATVVRQYAYDTDGQLITVKNSAGIAQESYQYDVNGNLLLKNLGGIQSSYTYDALDRVGNAGAIRYQYDQRGFMTSRGSNTFSYDTLGRLLSTTVGIQTVRYAYDALGRRTARTDAAGTTQYFYANSHNPKMITHVRQAGGTLVTLYYDHEGKLASFDRGTGAAAARYYVATDPVGSPRLITDATGIPIKQVSYSAFGEILNDSNPTFSSILGFAGGLTDPITGLVRFTYRDYEPATAHWSGRDPILFKAGQANIYLYTHNDPINYRDPTGLFCLGASGYGGVGGGAKICTDNEGNITLCAEVGLGEGIAVGGDMGQGGSSASLGVAGTAGVASGGARVGANLNDITNPTLTTEVTGGVGVGPLGHEFTVDPLTGCPSNAGWGIGEQAKVNIEVCAKL